MKWKISFKFLLSAWIFSTVVTSCKEIDLTGISNDIAINESLIAPVGETTLNVNDLLIKLDDPTRVHPAGDDIFITYDDSVNYSFRKIDLNAYAQTRTITINPWSALPSSRFVPSGTTVPSTTITDFIDLGLNSNPDEKITKAEINSANIALTLNPTNDIKNSIKYTDIKITIQFPNGSITNPDGSPYVIPTIIPSPYETIKNIPLTNFVMNTAGVTGIPVKVKVDAKTSSGTTVSNTTAFNCTLSFNQIAFKVIYGTFQPVTGNKEKSRIALDLPTSLSGLNLKFANPKVTLTVKSNIGASLLFNVDYVNALDKNNVVIASANFNGNPSKEFPLNKPAQPYEWSTTPIVLDKDNGATDRLFDKGKIPAALEYQFSSGVATDPAPSFLVPNAGIKAHVHVEVPLQLKAGSSVEMTDSIKDVGANLTSSMKDITIKTGTLVLDITNSFPAPVTFALVELKDANGNPILKDLKTVYTIEAPEVSTTDGSVTKTKVQRLLIELKDGQFDEFKKLKNLKFKITLGDKTSTNLMHFSPANFIKVKAGVFANGTITGNIGSTNN